MSSWFAARKTPAFQLTPRYCPRPPPSNVLRDDLIERRVAGHRVGQLARLLGIRAAELDRRRRAAALAVAGVEVDRARRAERHARGGIEPPEVVIAVERARPAAGLDAVAIPDRRLVVASGHREVPGVADRQRVGGVEAPRVGRAVEIDAGVERLAVDFAAGDAVAEGVDAGHAAIGIQVAELRRLAESRRCSSRRRRRP